MSRKLNDRSSRRQRWSWGRRFAAIALVGTATIFVTPSAARAYEDQIALSIDAGLSHVGGWDLAHGGQIGLGVGIGLGDTFSLTIRGGYGVHGGGPTAPGHMLTLGAEVVYLVDILTWVPFFGVGLNGHLFVDEGARGNVSGHAILGIDYLHSRELAFGLDARVGYLPFKPRERTPDGLYVQVAFRVSFLFTTY